MRVYFHECRMRGFINMKILRIICLVVSAVCVNGGVLPVDKCDLEDSKCMTEAFNKAVPIFMAGIPEIGVEVGDVMNLDDFSFDLAGLQFEFKEGKIKGLKNSVFEDVKWNLKKKHFDLVFHVDCTIKGHYTAAGRVLILPITGDGQMKLKLKHVQLKFRVDYDLEKGDEEKEYVIPKKYKHEFEVKENANYNLTNLFNGNKELSDAMLTFLNDNWKEISQEFGGPMIEAAAKKLFQNMVQFLKSQAIADIAKY